MCLINITAPFGEGKKAMAVSSSSRLQDLLSKHPTRVYILAISSIDGG